MNVRLPLMDSPNGFFWVSLIALGLSVVAS